MSPTKQCLTLVGPLDAEWPAALEGLMTSAGEDTNQSLDLQSGEQVVFPLPAAKLILETDTLAACSPSTAAKCGLVTMSRQDLDWRVLFESWFLKERVRTECIRTSPSSELVR